MKEPNELQKSEKELGQIYPIIKDQFGNIIDGEHRKAINPNWKETSVEITNPLEALRIRVHSNVVRRDIEPEEKHQWIMTARQLLNPDNPAQPSQREVAEALGMTEKWVWKWETYLRRRDGNFLRVFNIWNFSKCDERFGMEGYKGRIPGQIIQNCLYFFALSKDAKIVDPMAGSGTTFDVCKEMGYNNCLCYDIKSEQINKLRTEKTKEPCITFNDITKGLPKEACNADLIFIDPYYYDMITDFKSLEDFKSFIQILAVNSREVLKTDGKVAILMADLTRDEVFIYLRAITYDIFKGYFGEPLAVVSVPMTTEQANGQEVNSARENRKLLGRDRTLFVFSKEG